MIVFGLSESDLEKPTTEVKIVPLSDGNGKGGIVIVCVGEQVDLLDPENKSTLDYLGPGPYTIEWLAQWRCGKYFLQLTTPNSSGKGVNASKLKAIA